jgi:hypothetical protein
VQTTAKGQSLEQSGIAGRSSGQHDMPSGISDVIGIAMADDAREGAIGAKTRPIKARIANSWAKQDFRFIP